MDYQLTGMRHRTFAHRPGVGAPVSQPGELSSEPADQILATASDIARMMRISTRSLWRLRSGGQMPEPLRIGGAIRWRLDEIKQWIAAGCPVPQAPSELGKK